MMRRRSVSGPRHRGEVDFVMDKTSTIKHRGRIAEALHIAADEIAAHGAERLVSRAENVVGLREWR